MLWDSYIVVVTLSTDTKLPLHMDTLLLDGVNHGPASIRTAAEMLRAGNVVAIPTETVYGLAACATNSDAIAKVFEAKGRPQDNPLIVHVASREDVGRVGEVGQVAQRLIDSFFPGPLTIILPDRGLVSSRVTVGLDTVAVRMPDHVLARAIITAAGEPLAAPSANVSGHPSPTTALHVLHDLGGRIAAIVNGGPCRVGIESTVVRVVGEDVRILRPGEISAQQIAEVTGLHVMTDGSAEAHRSPGTRYRHYAPRASVELLPSLAEVERRRATLLQGGVPANHIAIIGVDEPLTRSSVYAALRSADAMGVEKILVHCDEAVQADAALMNRLRAAASGTEQTGEVR
jgi:L-threonylcarbamoyladenylate synthase